MTAQLQLSFPDVVGYAESDFMIADSNQQAFDYITQWPRWDHFAVVIVGAAGCGKTHLAHLWQQRSHARVIQAAFIKNTDVLALPHYRPCCVVENIQHLYNQTALLHLYNMVKERQGYMLFTSNVEVSALSLDLADLSSRLLAALSITLHQPEDSLIKALIIKAFSDRQLRISAEAVDYITNRVERSAAAITPLVERIDRAALMLKRNITIPLIAKVMKETNTLAI